MRLWQTVTAGCKAKLLAHEHPRVGALRHAVDVLFRVQKRHQGLLIGPQRAGERPEEQHPVHGPVGIQRLQKRCQRRTAGVLRQGMQLHVHAHLLRPLAHAPLIGQVGGVLSHPDNGQHRRNSCGPQRLRPL